MKLQDYNDTDLLKLRASVLQEIKTTNSWLHKRDLEKHFQRIEKERVRREWENG